MVTSVAFYLALVAAVAGERLVELWLSARNGRRLRARGAVEYGRGHYPAMVVVQTLFLASSAGEVLLLDRPFPGAIGYVMLGGVLGAQALRYWAVLTLGERWTTRILVLPDRPPIVRGPYRFLRHPNYLAVVIETLCLPLVHGGWLTAILFTSVNALLLRIRINAEERALGEGYARAFANRRRLWPRLHPVSP
jgi:methyltransferase